MNKIKESAETALRAAICGGQAIMEVYNNPETDWEVERKADNSPLTLADRKAHTAICTLLSKTPYPILSEEGSHANYAERKDWQRLWIVDPLDGTKEFLKRNGEFTVNIALVENGVPVLGVIYVPVQKKFYYGLVGEGAFLYENIDPACGAEFTAEEHTALSLPQPKECDRGYVVVASRSHLSAETEAFINTLRTEHGEVSMRSAGSSLKICLVAEGKADIYPRLAPTMEWDTAAGHAIVKAAGGEIYHAESELPLTYNKENLLNAHFIVRPQSEPNT